MSKKEPTKEELWNMAESARKEISDEINAHKIEFSSTAFTKTEEEKRLLKLFKKQHKGQPSNRIR